MDKSSNDEGEWKSKGADDNGNTNEPEGVSVPQPMDPSILEESKGYKHQLTWIFTLGDDTFTATFSSAAPRTDLSDSSPVTSYS